MPIENKAKAVPNKPVASVNIRPESEPKPAEVISNANSCLPGASDVNVLAQDYLSDNPAYSGLVTDLELAVFSSLAYKSFEEHENATKPGAPPAEDKRLRWWQPLYKQGWRAFHPEIGTDGFRAIAYMHEIRQQIVIAFRGTEPSEWVTFWIDWDEVTKNAVGSHGKQADAFTKGVFRDLKEKKKKVMSPGSFESDAYQVTFTGHSLGAWIASIATSIFDYPGVVFDNPGAKGVVEEYRRGILLERLFDLQRIRLTNYLAQPNIINTAHVQIGQGLQLTTAGLKRTHAWTDLQAEASYTLSQHSIELIVETFNPKTGMPYTEKVHQIVRWPHDGAVAVKKLVELLPEQLRDSAHLLLRWWFMQDVSYGEWLDLVSRLLLSISEVTISPSQISKFVKESYSKSQVYEFFRESYLITESRDYAQLDTTIPQNDAEAFNQRFVGHYHIDKFNAQSLSLLFFHDEAIRFFNKMADLQRWGKKVKFSKEYSYLNKVQLEEEPISRIITNVTIDAVTGKTAIDLRRELMKDFLQISNVISSTTSGISDNRRIYGIPTIAPNFVPRTNFTEKIVRGFNDASHSSAKIQTIFALGGMGKTQLAIQFAKNSYDEGTYDCVVWIAAEDDLQNAYRNFVQSLLNNKSEIDGMKLEEQIKKVAEVLSGKYQAILFVFDNIVSCEKIGPYLEHLPSARYTHILLTTQNQQLSDYYGGFEVSKFANEEAINYIKLSLSGRDITNTTALDLAEKIDFHPLTLSYVTMYIRREHITIKEFIDQYETKKMKLLNTTMLEHPNAKKGIAILVSLDQVLALPLAGQILEVCSFLAADDISYDILKAYFLDINSHSIHKAVRLLKDYSFVTSIQNRDRHFYMHRFLQDIIRYSLEQTPGKMQDLQVKLLESFRKKLANYDAVPVSKNIASETKENLKQLLIHAQVACRHIDYHTLSQEAKKPYVSILMYLGDWAITHASYVEARRYYEEALKIVRVIHGNDNHLDVARCLGGLGTVFHSEGNYAEARQHYEVALKLYQAIPGSNNHIAVAAVLNGLGNVFESKGNYVKARQYYKEAVKIFRRVYGDNHPDVGGCLMNLGNVFCSEGNYIEARQYYEEALNIFHRVYGDHHRNVAECLNNLGNVFESKGDYVNAGQYYEEALKLYREIHGRDNHPDVVGCLNNLGNVFYVEGNYVEARQYYEDALKLYRAIHVRDNHPDVAQCLNNLGSVLHSEGNYAEARRYYTDALKIYRAIHSKGNHPNVARCLNNLGLVFYSEGNYAAARRYYEKVLKMYRTIYGRDNHPYVAMCLNDLGSVFYREGNYAVARQYHEEALKVARVAYGDDHHPEIAKSLASLGGVFGSEGNHAEARRHYEEALRIYSMVYKDYNHPDITMTLKNWETAKSEEGKAKLTEKRIKQSKQSWWDWFSSFFESRGVQAVSIEVPIDFNRIEILPLSTEQSSSRVPPLLLETASLCQEKAVVLPCTAEGTANVETNIALLPWQEHKPQVILEPGIVCQPILYGEEKVPALQCSHPDFDVYVFIRISEATELSTVCNDSEYLPISGDTFSASSCKAVEFFGSSVIQCDGNKTSLVYRARATGHFLDSMNANLMLGAVLSYFIKQNYYWLMGSNSAVENCESLELEMASPKDAEAVYNKLEKELASISASIVSHKATQNLSWAQDILECQIERLADLRSQSAVTRSSLEVLQADIVDFREEVEVLQGKLPSVAYPEANSASFNSGTAEQLRTFGVFAIQPSAVPAIDCRETQSCVSHLRNG